MNWWLYIDLVRRPETSPFPNVDTRWLEHRAVSGYVRKVCACTTNTEPAAMASFAGIKGDSRSLS